MIIAIILLIISGLSVLLAIQPKTKLSNIVVFPFLIGLVLHALAFAIIGTFNIYYSKTIFITVTICFTVISIIKILLSKEKIKVKNDFKGIPFLYLIFIGYILYKFIIIATSTFINFNNWDELAIYQYASRQIYILQDMKYMHSMYALLSYFLGNMTYTFAGLSFSLPRIFGGIMYVLMSVFIYSRLKEFKVNRYIAAFLASFLLISSAENLLYYITFYANVYYACFLLMGSYLVLSYFFNNKDKSDYILGIIFTIGACLARRESFYHILCFAVVLGIFLFIIKNKKKWNILLLFVPVLIIYLGWDISASILTERTISSTSVYTNVITESSKQGLPISGTPSFIRAAFGQMFAKGRFTSNYLMFGVNTLALIVLIIKIILKKITKEERNMFLMAYLLQFIYLGIVFVTELTMMKEKEFLGAASFARYMMQVTPISFIILGVLLYKNTSPVKSVRVLEKITKKSKILLVIPAYNEEKSIKKTCDTVKEYNKKNKKYKLDVVVINDGSKDNTEEVLVKEKINHIKLLQNLGIGGAVQTGYKYAFDNDYDIVIQFDGDGQHDVNYVENIVKPIIDGKAHIVVGSRFVDKETSTFKSSLPRRIGIKIISLFIKYTTGTKVYDTTSGFRAVGRDLMEYFSNNYPTEYPEPISLVEVLNDGYIVKEIPANMLERQEGKSSIVNWRQYYYMINILISITIKGIGGRYYDDES